MDIQLFVRSHRGLELTEAVRQLQKEVQHMKEWSLQAMDRIRDA